MIAGPSCVPNSIQSGSSCISCPSGCVTGTTCDILSYACSASPFLLVELTHRPCMQWTYAWSLQIPGSLSGVRLVACTHRQARWC